VNQYKQTN